MRPTFTRSSSLCKCTETGMLKGSKVLLKSLVFLYLIHSMCPLHLVIQKWPSWESVCDGGICPRLASGPLRHIWRGLGLGGRQERGRAGTEDHHHGSTEAWLAESQRLSGSCGVSALIWLHRIKHIRIKLKN